MHAPARHGAGLGQAVIPLVGDNGQAHRGGSTDNGGQDGVHGRGHLWEGSQWEAPFLTQGLSTGHDAAGTACCPGRLIDSGNPVGCRYKPCPIILLMFIHVPAHVLIC